VLQLHCTPHYHKIMAISSLLLFFVAINIKSHSQGVTSAINFLKRKKAKTNHQQYFAS